MRVSANRQGARIRVSEIKIGILKGLDEGLERANEGNKFSSEKAQVSEVILALLEVAQDYTERQFKYDNPTEPGIDGG